jgi:Leucine-rich repeat (LRR) protein
LRCWRRETGTTLKLPSGRGALPALKANFEHIQKIELQGITWSDSAETFLAHFPRLTSLTIIESGLNTLPAPISAMPELVTLDLRSNHIVLDRQNATALSNLVRLQRIDLSGNALGMTPDFGNMPDLKVLNLSHTAIDQWPAGLQTQTGLELIDLRFNQLREVPPAQLDPAAEQLATMARINGVTLLDGNPFPNDYWRHFDRYWQRLWNSHPNLAINARTDAFDFASPPIQRLRHIHPNKSITEAREFLRRLGQDTEAELARLEREFQTLEDQLGAWSFSGGGARQRYVRANQMQIAAGMLGDRYEAQARLFACWRQETPQKLAYDGTPIGLELDLSGLTLPSLPDLDVDFSHVGSLKLNNMSLSASPEGFLSRFRHVRWLDLSNNQLRDLPPALGQMHGMTRLFLQNNQIVLTPETARILSERVTLRALVLEGNPLGITPDFSGITDIRSLNLSNIGIDTWPRGLSEQPALDTILLRNNLITTIPDSVIAPSDALLSQMIRINSVTDVSGNPLSDATLEQVRQFGERQTAQGTPATGSPNRLVLTAQIRPNETPFGRSAGIAFERWTQGMLQAQFAAKQAQWQTLIGQQGAEPFFNVLDRLSSNRAGHTDLQRRVWGVLDAISENSPESERLRREMFDRAGEPACCDRAAFSFSNLEVLAMVYSAHKKAGDHGQGQHLANLSRRLFRLHEVDRLAAEDIQRSEAIVRDPQMSFEEKRPHILRLREEVEIRLAYRFGLKAALELPGQPEKAHFLGMAGVSEEMLSKARKTVIDLDNSPAERQALLSREFWKDYLTNKYRQQFEEQRLPYQDRLADLHESLVAKQMTDQQYQSRSDDLQAQLAIEEATLMQELTRQELDHPSAAGRSTDL